MNQVEIIKKSKIIRCTNNKEEKAEEFISLNETILE